MAHLLVVVVLAAVIAVWGSETVPQHYQLVIFRLGRRHRIRGPGPCFVWPLIETGQLVLVAPQAIDETVVASSRDGVPVRVKWRARLTIVDAGQALSSGPSFRHGTVALVGSVIAEFTQECTAAELLLGAGLLDPQRCDVANGRLAEFGAVVDQLIVTKTTLPQRHLELMQRVALRDAERMLVVHDAELQMMRATATTAAEIERLRRIAELEGALTERVLEYERIRSRAAAAHHGARHVIVERGALPVAPRPPGPSP